MLNKTFRGKNMIMLEQKHPYKHIIKQYINRRSIPIGLSLSIHEMIKILFLDATSQ